MKEKKRKKFAIICKVDSANFVKYRSSNIENFFKFALKKYPGLRYANIFSNTGTNRGQLIGTYGNKKGLVMN